MVVAVENRAFLKSSKMAVVVLSLLAVLCTVYIYDDVDYAITKGLSSRLLGRKRRNKRRAYLHQPARNLVWVMSPPGGGASEIMNTVEHHTQMSMATNYGNNMKEKGGGLAKNMPESELVQKRWYGTGPFKNNVDYDLPPNYGDVLVETHCTGHCVYLDNGKFCDRIHYSRNLVSRDNFLRSCAAGKKYIPGRGVRSAKPYWMKRIRKVLIVVSDPMNIVVNHWYLQRNKSGDDFSAYCEVIDERYLKVKELKTAFRKKKLAPYKENVMCVTEIWRVAMWYKQVFEFVNRDREYMVVHLEDLQYMLARTTKKVLDFIGMKKVNHGAPPYVGMYHEMLWKEHWSREEYEKLGALFKAVVKSDSATWSSFERYFGDEPWDYQKESRVGTAYGNGDDDYCYKIGGCF